MTDQCKHCTLRGDITACKATPCYKHEDWYAVEQQKQLDQLTAINQELVEALEYQITHFKELNDNEGGLRPTEVYALSMVKDVIKRAKELANEG